MDCESTFLDECSALLLFQQFDNNGKPKRGHRVVRSTHFLPDSSNDALRAQGILPPKPPSRSPSPDIPHITRADATRALAEVADADQLADLMEGDGLDSDDERMFDEYRRKRLAEMRSAEKRGRFGSMEPLAREDFVREVTEGSKAVAPGEEVEEASDSEDEAPKRRGTGGTGVVVFLFGDS